MSVDNVIMMLEELQEEVSEKLQLKISEIITCLKAQDELHTKVSKARILIEELGENEGVESITRMQLFNAASVLETI